MIYDWNKPLLPGTVVCSKYNTFEGEEKVGIFIILYDEQNDSIVLDDENVIAIKISTKATCVSNYVVQMDRKLNTFFNEECIACCSKIHTLHKKQQVYKVIGSLNQVTYTKVAKMFNRFSQELMAQVINSI